MNEVWFDADMLDELPNVVSRDDLRLLGRDEEEINFLFRYSGRDDAIPKQDLERLYLEFYRMRRLERDEP